MSGSSTCQAAWDRNQDDPPSLNLVLVQLLLQRLEPGEADIVVQDPRKAPEGGGLGGVGCHAGLLKQEPQ